MTGKAPKNTARGQFGYAYLILNPRTGLFKIGSARRPDTRLATIRREMQANCLLLHTIATNAALRLEREIQSRFIDSHTGGEWFELDAEQVAVVQCVASVFYFDAEWQPRSLRRIDFDTSAVWKRKLPVCGHSPVS